MNFNGPCDGGPCKSKQKSIELFVLAALVVVQKPQEELKVQNMLSIGLYPNTVSFSSTLTIYNKTFHQYYEHINEKFQGKVINNRILKIKL